MWARNAAAITVHRLNLRPPSILQPRELITRSMNAACRRLGERNPTGVPSIYGGAVYRVCVTASPSSFMWRRARAKQGSNLSLAALLTQNNCFLPLTPADAALLAAVCSASARNKASIRRGKNSHERTGRPAAAREEGSRIRSACQLRGSRSCLACRAVNRRLIFAESVSIIRARRVILSTTRRALGAAQRERNTSTNRRELRR
ncbi:hypothetical protein MTO96_011563 [Rhipicephalus appendiculatus]